MSNAVEKKELVITPRQRRLIDAAVEIRQNEPEPDDKAFMTRYMVQATLPHRSPKGNPPTWTRVNGDYTLRIRPGYVTDPKTKEEKCVGYPFGSIPRLLMFWITTEALRQGGRKLILGSRLSDFMRGVGLNPRNGGGARSDAKRLRDQMERLFLSTISFEYSTLEVRRWKNMEVAPEGELWWNPKSPDQTMLWDSWIELGEKFYEAIIAAPVPVDMRALRKLKNSPLALDLYAWTTYRTYLVSKSRKSARITWVQLQQQIGTDYADPDNFKKACKESLRKVEALYPGLRLEQVDGGLIIHPGRPAIAQVIKPK
jgi:hypothetical protein